MFQKLMFAVQLAFLPGKDGLRSRVDRELVLAQHQLMTAEACLEIAKAEKALLLQRIKRLEAHATPVEVTYHAK